MMPVETSAGWWTWLLWVTAPFAGAVLGLIASVGTILQQSLKRRALARDERERRELRWMSASQIAGTLAFIVAVQVSVFRKGIWLPILGYLVFSVALTGSTLWWLPRISARRLAAEILEDPIHAPERHRRDRRSAFLSSAIGALIGWSTLIIALRLAHNGHHALRSRPRFCAAGP